MKAIHVLVIEDNPADVRLLREAFKASQIHCGMSVVEDGEAGLDYLFRRGRHAEATPADIVLLDLNLPGKTGLEVLRAVKSEPTLRLTPVVVLTTSDRDEDVSRSYSLHANCYIRKPPRLDDFIRVVRAIDDFWLTIVQLPTKVGNDASLSG